LLHYLNTFEADSVLFHSLSSGHRLTLRAALDALVAQAYGLSFDDFAWILRGCDRSLDLRNGALKGFWRVDKAQESSLRHTTLALEHFRQLLNVGNSEFCRNLLTSVQKNLTTSLSDADRRIQLKNDAQNIEKILAL
jgi:hypothetical protein